MSHSKSAWNVPGLITPFTVSAVAFALWWRFGFEPLDEFELPLAAWINGLTGRSHIFDWLVVFFNNFWGEAVTVIIAGVSYLLLARWVTGPQLDWRPVVVYGGYILAFWVVANAIGDNILEEHMPRKSPSYMLGDDLINLEEKREMDVKTSSQSSFPSNHGSVFFTLFFMCVLRWGKKAWVLLPVVILLSMPRCFTGAHWLSDNLIGSVLVTWMVAAVAIYTPVYQIARKLEEIALRIPPSAPVGDPPP